MTRFARISRFFLLLALILFGGISVYIFGAYRVKKVIVVTRLYPLRNIGKIIGKNLLLLKSSEISHTIISDNPFIESVQIELHYPETVVIRADTRSPRAVVVANDGYYQIDALGFVLGKSDDSAQYPKIEAPMLPLFEYSQADWRIGKAIKFMDSYSQKSIFIDRIVVDDSIRSYTFYSENGMKWIVPYESIPEITSTSLQIITSRFRIDGKTVESIDFRFDKPIVILSNGEKISSPL
ncbi:FtsQ-type POTRA domain-containing protein [Candidatus Gottesmanbacteria bacterium]|nr:FtsQ-type POTRA domain-containing protein [Candidatus Gottesmanbacteria bacterium]